MKSLDGRKIKIRRNDQQKHDFKAQPVNRFLLIWTLFCSVDVVQKIRLNSIFLTDAGFVSYLYSCRVSLMIYSVVELFCVCGFVRL